MKSLLSTLSIAALVIVSCSQNDEMTPTVEKDLSVEVEKEAIIVEDGSEPFEATWSADDAIQLYGASESNGTLILKQPTDDNNATFSGEIPEDAEYAVYPASVTRSIFYEAPFTITVADQTQYGNANSDHLYNYMYGRIDRRNMILLNYALSQICFRLRLPCSFEGTPTRLVFRTRSGEEIFTTKKGMFFYQNANSIVKSDRMVLNLEDVVPSYGTVTGYMALLPVSLDHEDMEVSIVTATRAGERVYKCYLNNYTRNFLAGRRYSIECTLVPNYITYPTSSYRLSPDGRILIDWYGNESELYLDRDPAFNNVTTIGHQAFAGRTSLHVLHLPSGVRTIGGGAFVYCYDLQTVVMPCCVTSIGDFAFYYCTSLRSTNIPSGVRTLREYTFGGCYSLVSLDLSEGLETIERYVFYKCSSLPTIDLPSTVISMSYAVFNNCSSLSTINSYPTSPPMITSSTLSGCPAVIHVPVGSQTAYQTAPYWGTRTIIADL